MLYLYNVTHNLIMIRGADRHGETERQTIDTQNRKSSKQLFHVILWCIMVHIEYEVT
jgi:hypothetical protein